MTTARNRLSDLKWMSLRLWPGQDYIVSWPEMPLQFSITGMLHYAECGSERNILRANTITFRIFLNFPLLFLTSLPFCVGSLSFFVAFLSYGSVLIDFLLRVEKLYLEEQCRWHSHSRRTQKQQLHSCRPSLPSPKKRVGFDGQYRKQTRSVHRPRLCRLLQKNNPLPYLFSTRMLGTALIKLLLAVIQLAWYIHLFVRKQRRGDTYYVSTVGSRRMQFATIVSTPL